MNLSFILVNQAVILLENLLTKIKIKTEEIVMMIMMIMIKMTGLMIVRMTRD